MDGARGLIFRGFVTLCHGFNWWFRGWGLSDLTHPTTPPTPFCITFWVGPAQRVLILFLHGSLTLPPKSDSIYGQTIMIFVGHVNIPPEMSSNFWIKIWGAYLMQQGKNALHYRIFFWENWKKKNIKCVHLMSTWRVAMTLNVHTSHPSFTWVTAVGRPVGAWSHVAAAQTASQVRRLIS